MSRKGYWRHTERAEERGRQDHSPCLQEPWLSFHPEDSAAKLHHLWAPQDQGRSLSGGKAAHCHTPTRSHDAPAQIILGLGRVLRLRGSRLCQK